MAHDDSAPPYKTPNSLADAVKNALVELDAISEGRCIDLKCDVLAVALTKYMEDYLANVMSRYTLRRPTMVAAYEVWNALVPEAAMPPDGRGSLPKLPPSGPCEKERTH